MTSSVYSYAATAAGAASLVIALGGTAQAQGCADLPNHSALTAALQEVVDLGNADTNGGLANDMWATVVNRNGVVCVVTFSGGDRDDQWLASRVISAQKANTANSLSLSGDAGGVFPGLPLSSGNLYGTVQPGGSLFGLQFSNPVDTTVAYKGPNARYGRNNDPMKGKRIGGINVFGGGLGLYDEDGNVVGGLGVSGDTSCTDHTVAWKLRDALELDFVATGVSATGDDNLIITADPTPGNFEHPDCGGGVADIIADLPTDFPPGANE